jgi:hypothetical protein
MFARTGPNAAESSEGFSVRRVSRTALEYRCGIRQLEIEVEPGDGLAVYGPSVRAWLPPHQAEVLSTDERVQVLSRVSEALRFLHIDHVVIPSAVTSDVSAPPADADPGEEEP